MAHPFPGKSSLPPLIDFEDDSNEFSVQPPPPVYNNNLREMSFDGLPNSGSRFVIVDPFDLEGSSHRFRHGYRSEFMDSTSVNEENPLGSAHSTLDHFLSAPHPPAQPPFPGNFENRDSSYNEVADQIPSLSIRNNARSSLDKPNSRSSDHHRSYNSSPDATRTSDQEFTNQRSSFSSITSYSDSGGSPERSFGSASFAEGAWGEAHGKERRDFNNGEEVSPFPYVPTHRKTSSYGQHLVTSSGSIDTISQGKRNTWRKHSLDERMPRNVGHFQTSEGRQWEMYAVNGETQPYDNLFGEKSDDESPHFLPEFAGSGGGTGIFKVPVRAAIHPGRPPSFELRPHPLRESQIGCFLRNITHIQGQLWAGQESGVRFWNLSDVFLQEKLGIVVQGDEETVLFYESARTSATLCLLADSANRLIWTGHKDGKIRSWKMDLQNSDEMPFKEVITWQAHRNPVLSLAISSYSDLWSGSEGGSVKVWPWEAIAKALDTMEEERHIAIIELERSYIDLRNQATVGGVCYLPAGDLRFMLADTCRAKVWGGGHLQFSLWDARTRNLLKVFGLDGQTEFLPDFSAAKEVAIDEEMKTKFVTSSKKEKNQASLSFFQRSRNALMGAADAVRRAAAKAPFGDDARRTEAVVMSPDGMIWTGCANGSMVQWDGNANRLQEFHHHSFAVQSICATGTRIWVGYASGIVQVMNLEGKLLGEWVAHGSPVTRMTVGGGYVFTMANHGGIRAWNMASPNPIDSTIRSELSKKEFLYFKQETLRILAGTWNVGQERASHNSLISWIGSAASCVSIVIVGLQEIEMGAGFLAMAAAKESVGLEGSANGQWWLDTIGKVLDERTSFVRVGSRQLAGLLIAIWVRKNLHPYVGDVDAAAVPCGFGHAIGNKGAVGLKMRVYNRTMCFVNCHFAAHLEAVNRRNADFNHVYRTMVFSRPTTGVSAAAAGVSPSVHLLRGVNNEDNKPDLAEADMLIFLGDFNYRLQGISYDEARDFVSQRCFDWLQERDQLRAEMKDGRVFQGMREAISKFPPTYKFERHQAGLQGYDSGEKKRIPAWCDRILFRDNRSSPTSQCSLQCPVVSHVSRYEACMDVTDSDHKPVRCIFNLEIAHIDESIRRVEFGNVMLSNAKIQSLLTDLNDIPETIVSNNNIILQDQETSILRITNTCVKNKATFKIICKEQSTVKDDDFAPECHSRGDYGFPRWLEVNPAVGVLRPGQVIEVSVHHEEIHTREGLVDGVPQNWWSEDTRDHEVILEIIVGGHCSAETRSHQIHVQHCFTSRAVGSDSRGSSRRFQSNHLQRPEHQNVADSSEFAYDFRSWQCP